MALPIEMKSVPVEPTEAMLDAFSGTRFCTLPPAKQEAERKAYAAMLTAAPVLEEAPAAFHNRFGAPAGPVPPKRPDAMAEAGALKPDFTRSHPSGIDDSTYEQIEFALDRADAPVTGSDGKFLSLAQRVEALRAQPTPFAVDEIEQVTKRFVIFTTPGEVPEKKGGWLKDEHLIDFLRAVMLHDNWKPGFRATVLELTWDNDLWASSATEYLQIHDDAIGPRRARKAWQAARDEHKRIYKTAPTMKLGDEIDSYRRLTAISGSAASETAKLFDAIRNESWDLRCFDIPTAGGDDWDIGWRVVGHWQAEPCERTVAEVFSDDPAEAVRQAIAAPMTGKAKE